MNYKVLGCTLILLGTCIGAGMLALPLAASQYSFFTTLVFLCSSWLLMSIGAFALLEVNLWMPSGSNLFTMTKSTLGQVGNIFALMIYLTLLYSLIAAYISGCSDLLQGLLSSYNYNISHVTSVMLVFVTLVGIVIFGVRVVDLTNRGLMLIKVTALSIMLYLMIGNFDSELINSGEKFSYSLSSFMVMITAFGFAIVIPSLREYLEDDHKQLACTLAIGCIAPLIIYATWVFAVHGVIPKFGDYGLISISHSANPNSDLIGAISETTGYLLLTNLSSIFATICAVTSFLGVSLSLVDFIRDIVNTFYTKFNFEQELENKLNLAEHHNLLLRNILIYFISFAVPLVIVLFNPGLFISALSYAGNLVLIFLVIMPLLMLYIGRYHLDYIGRRYLPGGRLVILPVLLISCLVLCYSIVGYI